MADSSRWASSIWPVGAETETVALLRYDRRRRERRTARMLPTSMADRLLQRIWARLSASELTEPDVSLRDDLRIAKLCILNVDSGKSDAWRLAFREYMGMTPEKWQGIRAEREAYQKTLGPTLAEQLKDPIFLASLDPFVRGSFFDQKGQARLDFNPKADPVSINKAA
jgi:hypothetical protein